MLVMFTRLTLAVANDLAKAKLLPLQPNWSEKSLQLDLRLRCGMLDSTIITISELHTSDEVDTVHTP
jgi:hypothetical protein